MCDDSDYNGQYNHDSMLLLLTKLTFGIILVIMMFIAVFIAMESMMMFHDTGISRA